MKTYDIHNKPCMDNKIFVKPLHMRFTAVEMNHDFQLDSPLRKTRGYAGDYILFSDLGFMMVVTPSEFQRNFQEVK